MLPTVSDCRRSNIPVPGIVDDTLGLIAEATSAMCMLYLGCLCCFSDWLGAVRRREVWVGIAVKMVLVPMVIGHVVAHNS